MDFSTPDTRTDMSSTYERRRIEQTPPSRSKRARLGTVPQIVSAAVMMLAGVVWAVTHAGMVYAKPGELLALPATVVKPALTPEEILIGDATPDLSAPVTQRIAFVLRKFAKDDRVADRAASALVREAARKNIDPVLLVGLMITENSAIDPLAKSNVGATGLMQVMPFHAGEWGCGSDNLVNVESNICHGVAILADYVRRSPKNLHKALLGYNGCVRGTNTPRCYTYSSKVYKHANNASRLMASLGGTDVRRYSAPAAPKKIRPARRASPARTTRPRATKPAPIRVPRKVVLGEIKLAK
jgi:hypothetical protein